MKRRNGFVSNSSSSSFVVKQKKLTPTQMELIVNHQESGEPYAQDYPWEIEVTKKKIKGRTSMDNFDMNDYMDKIGVKDQNVEWGW